MHVCMCVCMYATRDGENVYACMNVCMYVCQSRCCYLQDIAKNDDFMYVSCVCMHAPVCVSMGTLCKLHAFTYTCMLLHIHVC